MSTVSQELSSYPDRPELQALGKAEDGASDRSLLSRVREEFTVINLIFALMTLGYAALLWQNLGPYWFHPGWTTDDALQQIYPFHSVYHPEIFRGDLITEVMEGYLAPLHYWLSYGITWLTGDPIMMGHWMMLLQISFAITFLFLAVRAVAGVAPALFAVTWFLASRHMVQRMTSGLPRGWAAPVLTAFLYFLFTRKHRGVLVTLFLGCLLHPPATLIAAFTYGLTLLWRVLRPATRATAMKPLIALILLSPVYAGVTYLVVRRPPEIGQMVSYEEASQMPEFQYPEGRFPFVPLRPAMEELRFYSFLSFTGRFFNPDRYFETDGKFLRTNLRYGIVFFGLLLLGIGAWRRRAVLPIEYGFYLAGIVAVYFASRVLAFRLYVPNRHLQFPFAIFCITAFSIAAWRVFHGATKASDTSLRNAWGSALGLCGVGALVFVGNGTGLYGTANFNYSSTKKGEVFHWFRDHTSEDALVAGYPSFIDGLMLFGMRRAYMTKETAHPFYAEYNKEVRRRLDISLQAHFAKDLTELAALLTPEKIDYFVFENKRFYPDVLAKETYDPPLDTLVKSLITRPGLQYAYYQLPKKLDLTQAPYMVFRDRQASVIDVKRLKEFLDGR